MTIANPPHQPPWFPQGDPLDPLTYAPEGIKLAQRYVGDTHQLYDVIVVTHKHFNGTDFAKILKTDGIFANPFLSYNFSKQNSTNCFWLFQRFDVNNYPFATEYSQRVYYVLAQLKNVYRTEDEEIQDFLEGTNAGVTIGSNVSGQYFEAQAEVEEYTALSVTWFERDLDGSNCLRSFRFDGNTSINLRLYFEEERLLPFSMVIKTLVGEDVSGAIKNQLPKEFFYENLSFPSVSGGDTPTTELLISSVITELNVTTFNHTIESREDDRCCPPFFNYLWETASNDCPGIEQAQGIQEAIRDDPARCSASGSSIPVQPSQCPQFKAFVVPINIFDESELNGNYQLMLGADFPILGYAIIEGVRKFTLIEEKEVFQESDTITITPQETFIEVPVEFNFTNMAHLSRANNNHWNYPGKIGQDLGDGIDLMILEPKDEIAIEDLVFVTNKLNPNLTYTSSTICESNTVSNTSEEEETLDLKGRYFTVGRLTGFEEVEDVCDTPLQAMRTESYTKEITNTQVTTTECELIYDTENGELKQDELENNIELSDSDKIFVIDSYWYAYFDNDGTLELENA